MYLSIKFFRGTLFIIYPHARHRLPDCFKMSPGQVQRGCSTFGISYILDIDMYCTVEYFTCGLLSKNRLGKVNGGIIDTTVNLQLFSKLFELRGT